jgi:hypothetical protein
MTYDKATLVSIKEEMIKKEIYDPLNNKYDEKIKNARKKGGTIFYGRFFGILENYLGL